MHSQASDLSYGIFERKRRPDLARTSAVARRIRAAVDKRQAGQVRTLDHAHARLAPFGLRVKLDRESIERATFHERERRRAFRQVRPHPELARGVGE